MEIQDSQDSQDSITLDEALAAAYDESNEGEHTEALSGNAAADTGEGAKPETEKDESSEGGFSQAATAPSAWAEEHKEAFSKLPADIQQVINDREAERESAFAQKTQEVVEEKRALGEINDLLEPFGQIAAQSGMTKSQALGELLRIERFAATNPEGYIKWFSECRGISLQGNVGGEDDDYADPEIATLKNQIQQLKNQVQQATHTMQSQPVLQEAARTAEKFLSDVVNYPYAKEVEADMERLIPTVQKSGMTMTETLKAAYEQAIWTNPATRQKLLAAQQTEVAKKAAEDAGAQAAKAKKAAAASPARGNAAASPSNQQGTLDEELNAAFDRHQAA